jgi:hypothetical protein
VRLRIPLPKGTLTSDDVDSLLGLLESISTEADKSLGAGWSDWSLFCDQARLVLTGSL